MLDILSRLDDATGRTTWVARVASAALYEPVRYNFNAGVICGIFDSINERQRNDAMIVLKVPHLKNYSAHLGEASCGVSLA